MSFAQTRTEILNPRSIRFRITFFFVSVMALTLLSFSFVVYRAFISTSQDSFDSSLLNFTIDQARRIEEGEFGPVSKDQSRWMAETQKSFPFSTGEAFVQVLTPGGQPIALSSNLNKGGQTYLLPLHRFYWAALQNPGYYFNTVNYAEIFKSRNFSSPQYRLLTYSIKDRLTTKFILQIAVPMSILEKEKQGILTFFAFAIPITILITLFGGLILSGRAVEPIRTIIQKTKELSAAQLSERLPVPETRDELYDLTTTLNALFDRLDRAFSSQQRFVADASHQLRTPLAILRGELDVLTSRNRSQDEISEFLTSASQELRHLSSLVNDLLILAQMDAGAGSLAKERVRIDDCLVDCTARIDSIASKKGVKFRLELEESDDSSHCEVYGDEDLLKTTIHNLLENAVKYSPPKEVVSVRLIPGTSHIALEVNNQGTKIDSKDLTHIFEPFFRGSKNSNVKGVGLGLALAKRVIQAHDGRISATSSTSHGTTFRIVLPTVKKS